MRISALIAGLVIVLLGYVVVTGNPDIMTVRVAMLDITAPAGIACASAFGMGFFVGIVAVLTRDIPRMRLIKTLKSD